MGNKPKQSQPASPTSWRNHFTVHPAAELFPRMADSELVDLGEDIKKNGQQQPIAIIEKVVPRPDGSYHVSDRRQTEVLDGINRLDAMERVGFKVVDKRGRLLDSVARVEIDPKETDPYAYVVSNNIRRRHLNGEQSRSLIAQLLELNPQKSDRQIAAMVGKSHHTVADVRAEAEASGQIAHTETRTDKHGRQRPAHQPPKAKSTPGQTVISAEERRAQNAADDLANAQLDNVEQNIDLNPPTPKAPPALPARLPRPATLHSASSSMRPHKRTTRAEIAEAWLYAPHEERARFINDLGKDLFSFIPDDWVPAVEAWLATKQASRVLN